MYAIGFESVTQLWNMAGNYDIIWTLTSDVKG